MQHERLRHLFEGVDRVDSLLVPGGPQRNHAQRLGLSSREEGRSVRAGKHAHLAADRTDLVEIPAVRTLALVEDLLAHRLLLDASKDVSHRGFVPGPLLVVVPELGQHVFAQCRHRLLALLLVLRGSAPPPHATPPGPRPSSVGSLPGATGVHSMSGTLWSRRNSSCSAHHLLDPLVGDLQPFEDLLLGHLDRPALDHRDRLGGAGHRDVERRSTRAAGTWG